MERSKNTHEAFAETVRLNSPAIDIHRTSTQAEIHFRSLVTRDHRRPIVAYEFIKCDGMGSEHVPEKGEEMPNSWQIYRVLSETRQAAHRNETR